MSNNSPATSDRQRAPRWLRQVVKCLAHVTYWPLRISWLTFCVLAGLIMAAICGTLAWQGCVWCWQNWQQACVIAIVSISGAIIIAAYEWAKREISKDT